MAPRTDTQRKFQMYRDIDKNIVLVMKTKKEECGLGNRRNRDYEGAKPDEKHFDITFRRQTEQNF